MDKIIQNVLTTLHQFFKNEDKQYSEYEDSDIEYFVGCMLYNHFNFVNALDTMKTIDVSYDFLVSCENTYDEMLAEIKSIIIDDEEQKIIFLQEYIKNVKSKYSEDELYLLNRLEYHVNEIKQRYNGKIKAEQVDFVAPEVHSKNPLLR